MHTDKLIVTHVGALKAKYGARYPSVRSALSALVNADKARGLRTRVVSLDDPLALKRAGGTAVQKPTDQRATKAAIDALYRHHEPDYIVIVGAQDVVPHVDLNNPMRPRGTKSEDTDPAVPSDLPYACEAKFSRSPERFLGPTRVVGRVPDQRGASVPDYLLRVLKIAAGYRCRPRREYDDCFALSARLWVDSTELSVTNLFGSRANVRTSPTMGPQWTKTQLAPRIHFINCHGNTVSPIFSGEGPAETYFDAHRARLLRARIGNGTVVAAECCYGAELYDPDDDSGEPGICSTYLAEGAYGFFGSTTIAYGPFEGNGQADLICQYFIESVLKGASLGRAALEARQRFIAQYSHHDPSDLKTIAQFILLGDPAIHPVKSTSHSFARSKAFKKAESSGLLEPGARKFRRERMLRTGSNLGATVGAVTPAALVTPKAVKDLLLSAARESGLQDPRLQTWRLGFPAGAGKLGAALAVREGKQRTVHAIVGTTGATATGRARAVTAIFATVQGRHVLHVRRVHSR